MAWRSLLADFTDLFGAEHSHFVVFDGPGRVHFDYISLQEAGQVYADHYAALDTAVHRLLAGPERRAATQLDMMSTDELRACPVQQEMMSSFGVEHRLWVKSGLGDGLTCTSAIIRTARQDAFEPESYRLLEILHGHIERSLRLHFELRQARSGTASLEAGLDILATGLVLIDRDAAQPLMLRALPIPPTLRSSSSRGGGDPDP